jgi:hypothetical protein
MEANLVLVGVHGKGALGTAVLGSVSRKVADNCKRSVVVIKKPSQRQLGLPASFLRLPHLLRLGFLGEA